MNSLEDIVSNCVSVLNQGGTVLCPTSTVWGLSCDATDSAAYEALLKLKESGPKKGAVVLALREWFPELGPYDQLLEQKKPTTWISPSKPGLAEKVANTDGTQAIRFDEHPVILAILRRFGKPIVSTSANIHGQPSPSSFAKIDKVIKDRSGFVVPESSEGDITGSPSRLIRIETDGTQTILRE